MPAIMEYAHSDRSVGER